MLVAESRAINGGIASFARCCRNSPIALILFLHAGQPATTTPRSPRATDAGSSTKYEKSWRCISFLDYGKQSGFLHVRTPKRCAEEGKETTVYRLTSVFRIQLSTAFTRHLLSGLTSDAPSGCRCHRRSRRDRTGSRSCTKLRYCGPRRC
jgi:hypothetical protein